MQKDKYQFTKLKSYKTYEGKIIVLSLKFIVQVAFSSECCCGDSSEGYHYPPGKSKADKGVGSQDKGPLLE